MQMAQPHEEATVTAEEEREEEEEEEDTCATTSAPAVGLQVGPSDATRRSMYLGSVPQDVDWTLLNDICSRYGTVERLWFGLSKGSGKRASYAFVRYSSGAECARAFDGETGLPSVDLGAGRRLRPGPMTLQGEAHEATNLYVSGLDPTKVSDQLFLELFLPHGAVIGHRLLRTRRVGLVRFASAIDAHCAIVSVNNTLPSIAKIPLIVRLANPPSASSKGGGKRGKAGLPGRRRAQSDGWTGASRGRSSLQYRGGGRTTGASQRRRSPASGGGDGDDGGGAVDRRTDDEYDEVDEEEQAAAAAATAHAAAVGVIDDDDDDENAASRTGVGGGAGKDALSPSSLSGSGAGGGRARGARRQQKQKQQLATMGSSERSLEVGMDAGLDWSHFFPDSGDDSDSAPVVASALSAAVSAAAAAGAAAEAAAQAATRASAAAVAAANAAAVVDGGPLHIDQVFLTGPGSLQSPSASPFVMPPRSWFSPQPSPFGQRPLSASQLPPSSPELPEVPPVVAPAPSAGADAPVPLPATDNNNNSKAVVPSDSSEVRMVRVGRERAPTNVYVSGLPHTFSAYDLTSLFGVFGQLVAVRLLTSSSHANAAGLVRFRRHKSAVAAMNNLNGRQLPGHKVPLTVRFAVENSQDRLRPVNVVSDGAKAPPSRTKLSGSGVSAADPSSKV